ncbi:MAG: hypothetical protein K2G25_03505 [Oscillospiraceae bacterium]|nr:hypothetical protein [Oscillospiraceae bacterium]
MAKKCEKYRKKKDFSEEEFLSGMSEEDIDALANSKSDKEIEKIIAKYSD